MTKNNLGIIYTKSKKPNGNTEYTITYHIDNMFLSDLTKILCNPQNEILAFINIQQTSPQNSTNFKCFWVNIQEWHPELIGDFTYDINQEFKNKNIVKNNLNGYWTYDANKHLYNFCGYRTAGMNSAMKIQKNWFRIIDNNHIETNSHIWQDNKTCTYKCNTRPTAPTPEIKKLKLHVLRTDGTITYIQFYKQLIKNILLQQKQKDKK